MSYKKAQPKIADSLSVFIEQIENIEKSTASLQKSSDSIDAKMDLFYQYEPKLNFEPLETINEKQINLIVQKNVQIEAAMNLYLNKLEQQRKQKDSFFYYFSMSIAVMFAITVFCSYYAISNHYKKQKTETQFIRFLNDEKLKDKYVKWLNNKN